MRCSSARACVATLWQHLHTCTIHILYSVVALFQYVLVPVVSPAQLRNNARDRSSSTGLRALVSWAMQLLGTSRKARPELFRKQAHFVEPSLQVWCAELAAAGVRLRLGLQQQQHRRRRRRRRRHHHHRRAEATPFQWRD